MESKSHGNTSVEAILFSTLPAGSTFLSEKSQGNLKGIAIYCGADIKTKKFLIVNPRENDLSTKIVYEVTIIKTGVK
jgi:hypothetical protein